SAVRGRRGVRRSRGARRPRSHPGGRRDNGSGCGASGWGRWRSGTRGSLGPCCGRGSVRTCRFERGPLFLALVDLLLEGGGEGVAQELATLIQQESFAGVEDGASGCLLGL